MRSAPAFEIHETPLGGRLILVPNGAGVMTPVLDGRGEPLDLLFEIKACANATEANALVYRVLQGCGLDVTPPRASRPSHQDRYPQW